MYCIILKLCEYKRCQSRYRNGLQDRLGLDTTVMVAFRMSLIKMNSENKIDEVPITQAVGPVI